MIKKICDCCKNEANELYDLDTSHKGRIGLRTFSAWIDHYEVCWACYDIIMAEAGRKFMELKVGD